MECNLIVNFTIKQRENIMNPMKLKTPLILLEPSEIHLVEPLKLDNNPLFRREFLRKGGTTAIMLAIAPSVLFTRDAEANPLAFLAWVGKAAFAGAIGWFIDRTLDIVLPHFGDSLKGGNQLARELNVEERDPKPTAEYEFHNSHASPYVSLNPNYSFKPKYSDRYDYFVELDQYLRSDTDDPLPEFKDLSTPESSESHVKRIITTQSFSLVVHENALFPMIMRVTPQPATMSTISILILWNLSMSVLSMMELIRMHLMVSRASERDRRIFSSQCSTLSRLSFNPLASLEKEVRA